MTFGTTGESEGSMSWLVRFMVGEGGLGCCWFGACMETKSQLGRLL